MIRWGGVGGSKLSNPNRAAIYICMYAHSIMQVKVNPFCWNDLRYA